MSDAPPPPRTLEPTRVNSASFTALVLGVLAIVVVPAHGLFPYAGSGAVVLGGLALVAGLRARRQLTAGTGERGGRLATAGIALGGIALVLGIVMVILTAAGLATGDLDSLLR